MMPVILSAAKNPLVADNGFFAALRMTGCETHQYSVANVRDKLLSNRNSLSVITHFRRVSLPVIVENRSFGRVLMIGGGLFIGKVNGKGTVPASGLQSFNQQDEFPVDSIVRAQDMLFFHSKPHFLRSVLNNVKPVMEV